MRLKKIEILGFKSFADKTILEFSPGITAIVGPNGCGKSNISDAFRWVFGEQSAKSMRGGKMNDVIFAGTSHRAPLNFAEVTVTLADIAGKLPVDYDEVSVTRRLHRSGESNYFINRHPVRLKDVQDLFLDSGMGKDAFSIFEQGKIDQVINFSPLERRYIFEEAAGILRFLQRKREALRKMEQTDLNTSRVKDIHLEVEKQIIVLEKQAEKARLYKENKAALEKIEKIVFVAKWDNLQKRCVDLRKKEESQKDLAAEKLQEMTDLHDKLQEAKASLISSEKVLRVKSEELFKARSDKEIKVRERLSHQERLKENALKEKRWQLDLEVIAEKEQLRTSERMSMQKQQRQLEQVLSDQETIVNAQREKTQALESIVVKLREQQQSSQQQMLKILQTENTLESELKQNRVRQENQQERREQFQERQEKFVLQIKDLTKNANEKREQMQSASEVVDRQKERFIALEQSLENLKEEGQVAQKALHDVQHEIADGKARQKALFRLREEMEGFSAGSKRLLQEASNPKSPLWNKLKGLYELLTPQAGFESAMAAVLRPYAQTLVAQSEADFKEAIAFANQHNLKEFSLLCSERLNRGLKKDSQIKLTSLLTQVVENPISQHFLHDVFMAEDVAQAVIFRENHQTASIWVGQQGAYFDRQGVLFYASQGENNVFMREAELISLEKKLAALELQRQQVDHGLKVLTQKCVEMEAVKTELDKAIRRDEMKLVEINFGLQRVNADLDKTHGEEKQVANELQSLQQILENLVIVLTDLQQKYQLAKGQALEVQQRCAALNSELEKEVINLKTQQQDWQEKESSHRKVAEEHRKFLHALHVLEIQSLEAEKQKQRIEEELQLSREYQDQIKSKGTQATEALEEMESVLTKASNACVEQEQEVVHLRHVIEEIDQQSIAGRNRVKQIEEELHRMGIQAAQVDSAAKSLETELHERYHLTIEGARATAPDGVDHSIDQLERQTRGLRQSLEEAGDVNMTSIEEYDKHKVRYEFLNQQIGDLDMSKAELLQIITQLDGESRKIFKETFEAIRANFKKNFAILFQGGEADLQFTETADVLEAGIEIIAKPPGKQMRSINLLSGGEKCLTAMALLFAIFEVKPAPFCILDEIDAPLDDSNVERFVNVVKQFIDKCQFIVITHNKRTMAIADILFGVSMEERGISKLLAMSFSRQEREPELLSALG